MSRILIRYRTDQGEEREERWPTVTAFRTWAAVEGLRCTYAAYQEDDDGDWVVVDRGRV